MNSVGHQCHRACKTGRSIGSGAVDIARVGSDLAIGLPSELVRQSIGLVEEFDLRDTDVTPTAWPRLAVESIADQVVLAAFRLSIVDHPPEIVERVAREVAAEQSFLESNGWIEEPTTYYAEPPTLTDPHIRRDRVGRLEIERIRFPSGYLPHDGEPGRQRWEKYEHNHETHAWVLRHPDPGRPWLVCHHGASMGWALADLAIFRAAWLHHDLGLNLVFPVLPFHGPSRVRLPITLQLPVEDPVDTIHTFAQSVWDTRRILSWIRSKSDAPIAVHGISLGTYTAALIAALDNDLAGVIVGVPAASLSELYAEHMPLRLRTRPEMANFVEESRDILSIASPLTVAPLVPIERRFLYASRSDRITAADTQARRLEEHWGHPETLWFRGGHVGVAWSGEVQGFVHRALAACDLTRAAA